jgi:hypothetical protein
LLVAVLGLVVRVIIRIKGIKKVVVTDASVLVHGVPGNGLVAVQVDEQHAGQLLNFEREKVVSIRHQGGKRARVHRVL